MCFDSGPLKLFDNVLLAVPTMSESNGLNVEHFTKHVGRTGERKFLMVVQKLVWI